MPDMLKLNFYFPQKEYFCFKDFFSEFFTASEELENLQGFLSY